MPDLTTRYMGLQLAHPLVVASSRLSNSVENLKRLEDAGAAAVVLKSLFEEQIQRNGDAAMGPGEAEWHPEAEDYVRGLQMQLSAREYLTLVENGVKTLNIPIIASLNCVSATGWADYARQLQDAGAQALELNIGFMPTDPKRSDEDVRKRYLEIVDSVKGQLNVPVSIKIGPHFTSLSNFVRELQWHGVDALVLFNRFYRFDIDIENLKPVAGNPYSHPEELSLSLRWISVLFDELDLDLAASTGIHTHAEVIKQLLAGATVTQLCSTLFLNGLEQIERILEGLKNWMTEHEYKSVDAFRGRVSRDLSRNPELHQRLQYIRAIVGIE